MRKSTGSTATNTDYKIEVAKTGEVTIKGAIDFTKVTSDTTHSYSVACYET